MARRKNKRRKQAKSSRSSAASPSASSASPSSPPPSPSAASPSPWSPSPTITALAPPLTLCALIITAFFPALDAGFVWDDSAFTAAAPVQSWGGIAQIWFAPHALTTTSEVHYWPLLYTTFWLEQKLWGDAPLGYHIVNLILHAGVTLLLWRLLVRLKIRGAWFAAAVFAVHPVHTEAVAWVIGRKDVLSALCFLSAAWFYFNFVERRRRRDYAIALALFVAGMLSKSTVVTLPAALLIFHWWRHGAVTVADVKTVTPFAVVGAALALADWSYYTNLEILSLGYTLTERAQIASAALWFYAGKLIWPSPLMVIYPHFTVGAGVASAWASLVAAVTVAAALWSARRRIGRGAFAAAAFFALTLSPSLGFFDYGYMQFAFVADRYQYLAAAGVIVMLTAAVARVSVKLPAAVTVTAAATVIAVLSALSWQQSRIYENEGAFFAHIIAHNPTARGAYHNHGDWFLQQGRLHEARDAYLTAGKQRPKSFSAANDLAVVYEKLGQPTEAEQQYRRALRLKPRNKVIVNNLALLLAKQKRFDDALAMYQRLTKLDPQNANAHLQTGIALANLHRHAAALKSFNRALALNPNLTAATHREQTLRKLGG